MRVLVYLILIGLAIAFVGFSIVAFFHQREVGRAILIIGMFLTLSSMVSRILFAPADGFGRMTFALKIMAIGFSLPLLGVFADVALAMGEEPFNQLFPIGGTIILIGIFVIIFRGNKY